MSNTLHMIDVQYIGFFFQLMFLQISREKKLLMNYCLPFIHDSYRYQRNSYCSSLFTY